jgi:glutaconate CoA-transferase subunit A
LWRGIAGNSRYSFAVLGERRGCLGDKVMTMKEAISQYVKSGDTLFVSGAQHGEPSAAVHEIIRQKIDHLTLICALVISSSLLLGEGLLDKLLTGFMVQDEKRSYALVKAKAMNRYPAIEEYSHFGISLALFAGYMGVPFIPTRCQVGSDMPEYNDNIRSIECPFTGGQLGVVGAVVPDVGIIHVQRADVEGNAQKWGSLGVDREGINASRKVIVTTEKIVDSDVIRRDPNRTIIPGFRVKAVVEQAWGAHPLHLAGCYNGDMIGVMRTAMGDKQNYEDYMENLVYGVSDWNEYLEKRRAIAGDEYFKSLEIKNPLFSEPITTGY